MTGNPVTRDPFTRDPVTRDAPCTRDSSTRDSSTRDPMTRDPSTRDSSSRDRLRAAAARDPMTRERLRDWTKRALDVVVAALVLVLASPVLAAVALAVAVALGRPILFRQTRPGRHGRPFDLVKFRSMVRVDPATGRVSDGDRLTPLGRWLRATSLDELPTFWNVLRGDMSLVGPRPLLMQYLARYTPHQARRHEVRPGITGLAQVRGRNRLSWEKRFAYDVWYVDNRGLGLDLRILAETAGTVLRRDGITAHGSPTISEFVGTTAATTQRGAGVPADRPNRIPMPDRPNRTPPIGHPDRNPVLDRPNRTPVTGRTNRTPA
jgi:lipopolysaccharide/colanic/teichoic acid biosynthesis glycosyltransferase